MTSIDSCSFSAVDVNFAFSMKKSIKKDHMFGVGHDILVVCICFEVILLYHKVKPNWFGCGKWMILVVGSTHNELWVV